MLGRARGGANKARSYTSRKGMGGITKARNYSSRKGKGWGKRSNTAVASISAVRTVQERAFLGTNHLRASLNKISR